jgi:phosphinothricin acetyltransferase
MKIWIQTVGTIKESAFKFDRWLHSVFMQLILNKKSDFHK